MKDNIYYKTKRIHDLRVDHDLSQQQLAEILYCSRTTYGRYERGEREFPVSMLAILAEYYHVSVDELLGRMPKKIR